MTYRHTRIACYTGYVVQAIINLFPPLLFVRFQEEFGVTLPQLSLLVVMNFSTQIATDLLATPFILRCGYRAAMLAAQALAAAGLVCLAALPSLLPGIPYAGLLAAMFLGAIGGGLMEVLVSPVVESLPSRDKVAEMNFLHSAYCWGVALVILVSTGLFSLLGMDAWRAVSLVWAIVPVFNGVLLSRVPIQTPEGSGRSGFGLAGLLRSRLFWLFAALMVCAGASELAMSQWASLFAERGLRVPKTTGDLLGPGAFAVLMAVSRMWFGFRSRRIDLRRALVATSLLCVAGYALAVFAPWPKLSLAGCGLCGLAVGLMWPGTFSLASRHLPLGGTLLFALLAFAGDIGCAVGPGVVGVVSAWAQQNAQFQIPGANGDALSSALKSGMLCAASFPVLLAAIAMRLRRRGSAAPQEEKHRDSA